MPPDSPPAPPLDPAVAAWLLDADPAIRWQVRQDLLDAPAAEVAAECARVATAGAGAALLAAQAADGTWGGAAWNRDGTSTMHVLMLLRDLGLDPSSPAARRALARVRAGVRWPSWDATPGAPFWAGETEPCINGQVAAAGAYFGADVGGLIARLLGEQLADGGWNCEAERGSTRGSFNTTICVLEALLAAEQAGGADPAVPAARQRGEAYLLERRLFHRRSTGAAIPQDRKGGADWTRFAFPTWWHYDVLRGLDYLRRAGVAPDARVAEAVALVAAKRDASGPLAARGRVPRPAAGRLGRAGGRAEPLDHAARAAGAALGGRGRRLRAGARSARGGAGRGALPGS